jgi:hypothetical protein
MEPSEREQLKDQLRAVIAGRGEGIDLDTPQHWVAAGISESMAPKFFASLEHLLPPGSILYFEGTAIAPDVAAFYSQHRAKNAVAVVRDTIHPAPETFHVDYLPSVVAKLCEFLATNSLPEAFDHVKAYAGESLLFTFHDAFSGYLRVSQHVPENAVNNFANALKITFTVEETQKRDPKQLQHFLQLMEDPNAFRKLRIPGEPRWRTWWRRLTGR